MPNIIKFNVTSFFNNGAENFLWRFSQLWRVIAPQHSFLHKNRNLYFIPYPITYQNIKTELNSILQFFQIITI